MKDQSKTTSANDNPIHRYLPYILDSFVLTSVY